jgi:hypothetical protein
VIVRKSAKFLLSQPETDRSIAVIVFEIMIAMADRRDQGEIISENQVLVAREIRRS